MSVCGLEGLKPPPPPQILVNACDELAVPVQGANAALAEKFENVSSVEAALTPEMAKELKALWNDASVQVRQLEGARGGR